MIKSFYIIFFFVVVLSINSAIGQEFLEKSTEDSFADKLSISVEDSSSGETAEENSASEEVGKLQHSPEFLNRMERTRAILSRTDLAKEMSNATVTKSAQSIIDYIVFETPKIFPQQIPSVFFTDEEIEQIKRYEGGTVAADPSEEELNDVEEGLLDIFKTGSGIRELRLGGILYVSNKDWIIWLNGQKMTPKRLAPEIVDIKINKNYIKVDWYDSKTNQIFPVKLKPHQRFNLDSRIFLPG